MVYLVCEMSETGGKRATLGWFVWLAGSCGGLSGLFGLSRWPSRSPHRANQIDQKVQTD
jgi:hypothetical protein